MRDYQESLYDEHDTIQEDYMEKALQTQITKEMHRLNINGNHDDNIKIIGDTGLITFTIHSKPFWAKLTPTGKLKKNSIRIDNF